MYGAIYFDGEAIEADPYIDPFYDSALDWFSDDPAEPVEVEGATQEP